MMMPQELFIKISLLFNFAILTLKTSVTGITFQMQYILSNI